MFLSEEKSPERTSNVLASPTLHTQKSIFGIENFSESTPWEYDNALRKFEFDVCELKSFKDQYHLTIKVLITKLNISKFNLSLSKFSEFWQELRRKYNKRQNFFHNFEHGLNGFYDFKLIFYIFINK